MNHNKYKMPKKLNPMTGEVAQDYIEWIERDRLRLIKENKRLIQLRKDDVEYVKRIERDSRYLIKEERE